MNKPSTSHYEFKYIFQSSHFAGDLLELIARKGRFDNYRVKMFKRIKITDTYYDEWLPEEDSFRLASKGVSCRWREIGKKKAFEIKQPQQEEKDYIKYVTIVKHCQEREFATKVLPVVRNTLQLAALPTLSPVARIVNKRCVLSLITASGKKWARLHLDSFQIANGNGNILEDECYEIEAVSNNDQTLSELSEIFITSFKLIKIEKSKIERYAHALVQWQTRGSKVKLWLDADTGVDDAMALLLALRSQKRCTLVGISAVGGNVSLEKVLINSAKIIHYSAVAPRPPLFKGFTPSGSKPDASNVHGEDGIGNIDGFLSDFNRPVAEKLIYGFRKIIPQHRDKEITFVATGPLTNLARLTQECPNEVRKLRHIVIMGGAFDEPGNREAQSEFNIYSDPESAQVVLKFIRNNGIRHSFVPLDVTHRVVLKRDEIEKLCKAGNRNAKFIRRLTKSYMQFYYKNQAMDGCPLHDPMAVGFALWPELFISDDFHVEIAPSHLGPFSGATSADFRPTRLFRDRSKQVTGIVLQVDQKRFLKRVKTLLFQAKHSS